MAVIRRGELLKIWNGLVVTLNDDDLRWLREHRQPAWQNFSQPAHEVWVDGRVTEWQSEQFGSIYNISFRIQDVVDAKMRDEPRFIVGHLKDRVKVDYFFAEGMPKGYLIDIAKILGVIPRDMHPVDVKMNKWELVNAILEKLESGKT